MYQQKIEELFGFRLVPTYSYGRTYDRHARLLSHTDRPSCEISVTLNICGDAKWPIKLKDLSNKKREVVTPVGHGVAYQGTIVPHWRSPLRTHKNDRFMQLFLHYVRKNGPYADYAYDRNQKCYNLLNQ